MNQENRKKSEAWVKEKANEFTQLDCDLTFAEWCYHQGRTEAIAETLNKIKNHKCESADELGLLCSIHHEIEQM